MRVRATARGYYNDVQREPGDVFDLIPIYRRDLIKRFKTKNSKHKGEEADANVEEPNDGIIPVEEQFSDLWMEEVADDTPLTASEPTANRDIDKRLLAIEQVPEVRKYLDEQEQKRIENEKDIKESNTDKGFIPQKVQGSEHNQYGDPNAGEKTDADIDHTNADGTTGVNNPPLENKVKSEVSDADTAENAENIDVENKENK